MFHLQNLLSAFQVGVCLGTSITRVARGPGHSVRLPGAGCVCWRVSSGHAAGPPDLDGARPPPVHPRDAGATRGCQPVPGVESRRMRVCPVTCCTVPEAAAGRRAGSPVRGRRGRWASCLRVAGHLQPPEHVRPCSGVAALSPDTCRCDVPPTVCSGPDRPAPCRVVTTSHTASGAEFPKMLQGT